MKRRGPALLAAVINLALAITALSWPSNSEPSYKGKKLSEWLGLHNHWYFSESLTYGHDALWLKIEARREAQVVEAVQTIGTNGFPCLLRWIAYETPWWQKRAIKACAR